MKLKLHITLLAAFIIAASCNDDNEAPSGPVYLKSLDLGETFYNLGAFGLEDGSAIMTLWGLMTSDLIKIDKNGSVLWRSDISGNVWCTWASRPLRNGNILVYGFDCFNNKTQAGAVIFSPEGELIHSVTFQNQVGSSGEALESLDGMELSNGEIALVMPVITSASSPTMVRLMRFDQQLQLLESRIYPPDDMIANVRTRQITMAQDKDGNLLIQGRTTTMIFGQDSPFAFVMKVDGESYDPVYFETFEGSTVIISSRVAAAQDGAAVWAFAGPTLTSIPIVERFSLISQEFHSIGTEINVYKSNGKAEELQTTVITGFPKFGYIHQVRSCSDGGFILTGTCNFNSNQEIPSDYRILLVKLDRNLKVQWTRIPDTHYGAVGADAVEIPGGYLVSGTHYSFHGYNLAIVYKIDYDGNMN